MEKKWLLILLVIFLLAFDRITKIIFLGKDLSIFNYTENTGALFGLFRGNNLLFIILSSIILILIILYFIKTSFNKKIALIFIIAGILSNLIDRIFYGHVIDFIDVKFWPVFNLADVFVVIGIILLVIHKK